MLLVDLTKEIQGLILDYFSDVDRAVFEVEDAVAKEAIKKLKATSPRNQKNGGHKHYADDWKIDATMKKNYCKFVIKNNQYRLTHLLENGHDVVSHGKKAGHVAGRPHIKPVEEWANKEVEKRIKEVLS